MENDFTAIGDTVTDAFIKLQDAEVHCNIDNEDCTISMKWGDKIPYEDLTVVPGVGNAANAAVSAARLGLTTAYVTNIGNDTFGKEIIEHFKKEGLDTTHVTMHDNVPTNYHFVLSFQAERTILIKHQAYKYVFPKDLAAPKMLYFSSLGESADGYHDELADWLDANPETTLAFQPGTFQMKIGAKRLQRIYKKTKLFFANKEEYQRILELPKNNDDIPELLSGMQKLGPEIPILTNGRDGAYALVDDEIVHVDMFPDPAPPVERTGAGDAFSSTTAAYFAMGLPLKDAMIRGTVNSAYVVQKIGAQEGLLTKEELESKL